jgi:pimeloyl-ACP methyl ester carboxylesterase
MKFAALTAFAALGLASQNAAKPDTSPHFVQFIAVDKDVKLEVLDWGGSGRPLVLLAGLGGTAHDFNAFARKLTDKYHVYGITRRGFGASGAPTTGYSADRLGDDVLAVIEALKLDRPVLAGHSLAGQEMSSIGSRHPGKVAGLIYLEAGYSYAYYDRARGDLFIDLNELERKIAHLYPGNETEDQRALVRELLETSLPAFEKSLREFHKMINQEPRLPDPPRRAMPPIMSAIFAGWRKYTEINVPILAIYALPHDMSGAFKDPAARKIAEARDIESTGAQANAFEKGLPSARVVRLANADHSVFQSNEADVLREMRAFIDGLPK